MVRPARFWVSAVRLEATDEFAQQCGLRLHTTMLGVRTAAVTPEPVPPGRDDEHEVSFGHLLDRPEISVSPGGGRPQVQDGRHSGRLPQEHGEREYLGYGCAQALLGSNNGPWHVVIASRDAGRAKRTAQGKTSRDAQRCIKRALARTIFKLLERATPLKPARRPAANLETA